MSGRCQLSRAHVCENKTALLSGIKNGGYLGGFFPSYVWMRIGRRVSWNYEVGVEKPLIER